MKKIVLGPPRTGKSTLARYLRQIVDMPVLDFDDELLSRNNGNWPGEDVQLNTRLRKEVEDSVISRKDIVFMAFEVSLDGLRRAKAEGFMIYQLVASRELLVERSAERQRNDPTNDAFKYIDSNLAYQKLVKDAGLVDVELKASTSTEDLAKSLLGR